LWNGNRCYQTAGRRRRVGSTGTIWAPRVGFVWNNCQFNNASDFAFSNFLIQRFLFVINFFEQTLNFSLCIESGEIQCTRFHYPSAFPPSHPVIQKFVLVSKIVVKRRFIIPTLAAATPPFLFGEYLFFTDFFASLYHLDDQVQTNTVFLSVTFPKRMSSGCFIFIQKKILHQVSKF